MMSSRDTKPSKQKETTSAQFETPAVPTEQQMQMSHPKPQMQETQDNPDQAHDRTKLMALCVAAEKESTILLKDAEVTGGPKTQAHLTELTPTQLGTQNQAFLGSQTLTRIGTWVQEASAFYGVHDTAEFSGQTPVKLRGDQRKAHFGTRTEGHFGGQPPLQLEGQIPSQFGGQIREHFEQHRLSSLPALTPSHVSQINQQYSMANGISGSRTFRDRTHIKEMIPLSQYACISNMPTSNRSDMPLQAPSKRMMDKSKSCSGTLDNSKITVATPACSTMHAHNKKHLGEDGSLQIHLRKRMGQSTSTSNESEPEMVDAGQVPIVDDIGEIDRTVHEAPAQNEETDVIDDEDSSDSEEEHPLRAMQKRRNSTSSSDGEQVPKRRRCRDAASRTHWPVERASRSASVPRQWKAHVTQGMRLLLSKKVQKNNNIRNWRPREMSSSSQQENFQSEERRNIFCRGVQGHLRQRNTLNFKDLRDCTRFMDDREDDRYRRRRRQTVLTDDEEWVLSSIKKRRIKSFDERFALRLRLEKARSSAVNEDSMRQMAENVSCSVAVSKLEEYRNETLSIQPSVNINVSSESGSDEILLEPQLENRRSNTTNQADMSESEPSSQMHNSMPETDSCCVQLKNLTQTEGRNNKQTVGTGSPSARRLIVNEMLSPIKEITLESRERNQNHPSENENMSSGVGDTIVSAAEYMKKPKTITHKEAVYEPQKYLNNEELHHLSYARNSIADESSRMPEREAYDSDENHPELLTGTNLDISDNSYHCNFSESTDMNNTDTPSHRREQQTGAERSVSVCSKRESVSETITRIDISVCKSMETNQKHRNENEALNKSDCARRINATESMNISKTETNLEVEKCGNGEMGHLTVQTNGTAAIEINSINETKTNQNPKNESLQLITEGGVKKTSDPASSETVAAPSGGCRIMNSANNSNLNAYTEISGCATNTIHAETLRTLEMNVSSCQNTKLSNHIKTEEKEHMDLEGSGKNVSDTDDVICMTDITKQAQKKIKTSKISSKSCGSDEKITLDNSSESEEDEIEETEIVREHECVKHFGKMFCLPCHKNLYSDSIVCFSGSQDSRENNKVKVERVEAEIMEDLLPRTD